MYPLHSLYILIRTWINVWKKCRCSWYFLQQTFAQQARSNCRHPPNL